MRKILVPVAVCAAAFIAAMPASAVAKRTTTGRAIEAVAPGSSIDTGGTSVVKASGAAVTFTLAREDGGAFEFGSMDFGKLTSEGRTAATVYQFFFTLADAASTVVTRYFAFDHQNPDPIVAHTAIFDDLGAITQFTFRNQTQGGQFDNIVLNDVTAVPEPATWAMLLTGFFGIGAALRWRGRGGANQPVSQRSSV